jgi:hypothetical protein
VEMCRLFHIGVQKFSKRLEFRKISWKFNSEKFLKETYSMNGTDSKLCSMTCFGAGDFEPSNFVIIVT